MLPHNDRSDIPSSGGHPVTIASARDLRSIRLEKDPVGSDTQGWRL
jgi:hypothetical protein